MQFFRFVLLHFCLVLSWGSTAQTHYNIRLNPTESGNQQESCYHIQLASADAKDLNLAGQNYRLYYDASKLRIQVGTGKSLLPAEKYSALIIKNNLVDIDAGGIGNLAFEEHLGFINLGNDLKDELNGGIALPASGEWVSTAKICFDRLYQETTPDNSSEKNSLFWARSELTKAYATAYVEVAEWIAPSTTVPAKAAVYFDEEASTSNTNQEWAITPTIYPNPTSDHLFIKDLEVQDYLFQLYTQDGKLVYVNRLNQKVQSQGIDVSSFSSGMYHLRISNKDKMLIKKIEIIH